MNPNPIKDPIEEVENELYMIATFGEGDMLECKEDIMNLCQCQKVRQFDDLGKDFEDDIFQNIDEIKD